MMPLVDTTRTMSASADIAATSMFDVPIVATLPDPFAVIPVLSFLS